MATIVHDNMEDDNAALREALALLGDWESELEALLSPVTPPREPFHTAQTQSPRAAKSKRPRRAAASAAPTEYRLRRDARNAQLADLQNEVQELQRLLEQEQARLVAKRDPSASALTRECEEMAGRQKRQRTVAEDENAALRRVIITQHEFARRMKKLAHKAAVVVDVLGPSQDVRRAASLALFAGPTIATPHAVRHLDSRRDEASAILSTGVFQANGGRDFQQVSFRDLGFDGLQVEFAISWVVPFGVETVERALWAHMTCTSHQSRATDHQFTHSTSDLLCSRFVSEPKSHEQMNCNHGQPIPGVTHGQAAVRRYPPTHDGTRTVMNHIRARIFHDDGKPKGDMHGDGWFQVEPLHAKATATTPSVSRIKWCRRVTGRPIDHDTATQAERTKWVHSVVTGPMRRHWEGNLALNMSAIENFLLTY